MIEFKSVSKVYQQGQIALQNINFKISSGEFVYLTGHSGAGKTSLMQLIAVIERASIGQVLFNGKDITDISLKEIPYLRRRIGMIFQDHHLMLNRTVAENVALPLLIRDFDEDEAYELVKQALEKVGLQNKEEFYPLSLSTGEQQRVGIARAVVARPDVILADEPTGNLDKGLSQDILALFELLNRDGTTVVMASHDTDLLSTSPHRTLVLNHGHLVYDGEFNNIQ